MPHSLTCPRLLHSPSLVDIGSYLSLELCKETVKESTPASRAKSPVVEEPIHHRDVKGK